MTTPIPLRLAQRKRELEDLIATHQASARSAGDKLAGINEAIQAYEDQAEEHAAIARLEPVTSPAEERTRARRRDIRGMVLELLDQQGAHTVDEIVATISVRPQQARDALEHLRGAGKVETTGNVDGPWRLFVPDDPYTADHGREPTLAQDAAA